MKDFIVNSRNRMLFMAFCFAIAVAGCRKGDNPHDMPVSAKLLVTGLKELQGSTVGPDKALYVTAPLDGTIWRVDPKSGDYEAFVTGLPKRIPDLFYIGSGVVDVAFRGKIAYA